MKKRTLFLTTLAALSVLTSCGLDQDPGTGMQYYSFVTVDQDKLGADKTSFTTDDDKVLIPTNLTSPMKVADGRRAMAYFYLKDPNQAGELDKLNDVQIILSKLDTNVVVAPTARVADAAGAFALGNNGTSLNLNPYYPQTTRKYFNFYVCVNASDLKLHKFYLTHADDAKDTDEELHLTLVHDDGDDTSYNEKWFWLSFPVEDFSDLFGDRKTAVVALKTRTEGMQTVRLPLLGKADEN